MRRIVDALKPRNHLAPVHDPTGEEQRHARRERAAAEYVRGVIARWPEIPRSQLTFTRYWIEADDGRLLREFGGDPGYANNVVAFYFNATGQPVMLEPADPPNRSELERRQAAKLQRRADKEAATKALWKARREALR